MAILWKWGSEIAFINIALLNTKRAILYVGRFKGQKPGMPSKSVCVLVPIGGAFHAGCRDGNVALWGLGSPWYCESLRQDNYWARLEGWNNRPIRTAKDPLCQQFSRTKKWFFPPTLFQVGLLYVCVCVCACMLLSCKMGQFESVFACFICITYGIIKRHTCLQRHEGEFSFTLFITMKNETVFYCNIF